MTSISTDRVGGMVPEGIHPFHVVEFEERTGPSGDYWNFTCEITGNSPFAGQRCWVVISLSPQSRWKAEQWLDCFTIPEGMEIDGEDFVGLAFRGKVIHEEGKDGKMRAKIDEFLPSQKVALKKGGATVKVGVKKAAAVEEGDEEDDDDEETAVEEEDDTDDADEDDEEDDDDEETAVEEEDDDDEETAVEEEDDTDDADEDDEEDEDEEEEEVITSKTSKKPVKAVSKPIPVKKGTLPKPKSKYKRPF